MVQTLDLRISNIAKKKYLALIMIANSVLKQESQLALEKQSLCISGALHNWVFNSTWVALELLCPILNLYFCISFGNLILIMGILHAAALPCGFERSIEKYVIY